MESWSGKRYNSWNCHLQSVFGEKVAKIALDGGFSCPNRQEGRTGCIYCSPRGSGDFAGKAGAPISQQFAEKKKQLWAKWPGIRKFIAYFQAYTNTYAPVSRLKDLYLQSLEEEGVVGLAIATRPDCIPEDVLDLLAELAERTWLMVELGLQTVHNETLRKIQRGHDYSCFVRAMGKLQERDIPVCAHIILGLPGESKEMMLETASKVAALGVKAIKIHLLTVLRGTPLAAMWERGEVPLPHMAEYAAWVADILEILPPEVVVQRLTGDAPAPLLLAPAWSLRKWETLMAIEGELSLRDSWQGKKFSAQEN